MRYSGKSWADGKGAWDNLPAGANGRISSSKFLGSVDLDGTMAGIANWYGKGTIQRTGSASFDSGNVESLSVN